MSSAVFFAGKPLRSSDADLQLFGLVGINRAHSDETFHVLQQYKMCECYDANTSVSTPSTPRRHVSRVKTQRQRTRAAAEEKASIRTDPISCTQ